MNVRPGAEPFHSDGDDVGVLVLHGFTGNPTSMRPWAEAIAATGRTVALPRLPGHGTTVQDMRTTRWEDWVGEVDSAFHTLRAKVSTVVVCGLSMGGALALTMAERYPAEVAGLVLVNPAVRIDDPRLVALPVVKWLTPYLPPVGNDIKKAGVVEDAYAKIPSHALASSLAAYKGVVADLPKVTAPLLLIRSRVDHVVPASSSALILSKVSSPDPVEIVLEDSYHVATLDNDAPTIFAKSLEFIEQVTSKRTTA